MVFSAVIRDWKSLQARKAKEIASDFKIAMV
jgi:hypothetical protein